MKKYAWRLVLIGVGLATLWLGGKSIYQLWGYGSLSQPAPARLTGWEIVEASESKFFLEASYEFLVDQRVVAGKEVLKEPVYLNRYAARAGLEEAKRKEWSVWYNPSNPAKNSLVRQEPWTCLAYALLSFGVFFYFLWRWFQCERDSKQV